MCDSLAGKRPEKARLSTTYTLSRMCFDFSIFNKNRKVIHLRYFHNKF